MELEKKLERIDSDFIKMNQTVDKLYYAKLNFLKKYADILYKLQRTTEMEYSNDTFRMRVKVISRDGDIMGLDIDLWNKKFNRKGKFKGKYEDGTDARIYFNSKYSIDRKNEFILIFSSAFLNSMIEILKEKYSEIFKNVILVIHAKNDTYCSFCGEKQRSI